MSKLYGTAAHLRLHRKHLKIVLTVEPQSTSIVVVSAPFRYKLFACDNKLILQYMVRIKYPAARH